MFDANGRTIRLSQGDTGLIKFDAGIKMNDADRAVFTVRRRTGAMLIQKVMEPEGSMFLLPFTNEETQRLPVGDHEWDLRIVLDAVLDGEGRVTDGREVITPVSPPGAFKVKRVVGRV